MEMRGCSLGNDVGDWIARMEWMDGLKDSVCENQRCLTFQIEIFFLSVV